MKLSERKKKTLLIVSVLAITVAIVTFLIVFAISRIGNSDSDQMLSLLCESGEYRLNSYFESVEQSVEMVSAYVESDLASLETEEISAHLERAKTVFARTAGVTNGVLTYYYRIDPDISSTEKGFWFVNLDGKGFTEHEPTDISLYDTSDTSSLVWFTVPKNEGGSVWLPPYITDNLDVRVISYNVPVYHEKSFVGVIGIEIDYSTMAEQVSDIGIYDSGYAFVLDPGGQIIYHPLIDVNELEYQPKTSEELLVDERFINYRYNNTEKRAVWMPLSNGMRLYVTAPVSEINSAWMKWVYQTVAVSVILIIVIALLLIYIFRILHKQKEASDKAAELEKALRNASEITELMGSMSSLLTNMPAMSFSKDAVTGKYLACNKPFAVYAGKSDPKEIVGLTDYDLFDADAARQFIENDKRTLAMDEANVYFEDAWDVGSSTMRYLQTTKKTFKDATGKLCILGMCVDVTKTTRAKAAEAADRAIKLKEKEKQELEADYKQRVEKLSYKASHDDLTGVYNRAGFDMILSEVDPEKTYLLMVDADNFKYINDNHGHDVGDKILIRIATILQRHFRSDDYVCRIGGDEFVVVMVNAEKNCRELIASKIGQINRELNDAKDGLPAISISVGVTHGSEAPDRTALLEIADKAMYETKRSGKNGYRFSDRQ